MDYKAKFAAAMSVDTFYGFLGENRELHDKHYERADVDSYHSRLSRASLKLRILILTEPWCSDSLSIVPVVLKMLKGIDSVEIRFLLRDENPDLMDLHLTKGGRAIPKFIILDDSYKVLLSWGPRPSVVQDIYESMRPDIDAERIPKIEATKKIRAFYGRDRGRATAEEFCRLLLEKAKQH